MEEAGRVFLTLDNRTTLDAEQSDSAGFIRGLDHRVAVLDQDKILMRTLREFVYVIIGRGPRPKSCHLPFMNTRYIQDVALDFLQKRKTEGAAQSHQDAKTGFTLASVSVPIVCELPNALPHERMGTWWIEQKQSPQQINPKSAGHMGVMGISGKDRKGEVAPRAGLEVFI